ncbi:geranylgeranylglyceryl phosphate synthase [Paenisporosarcina sp. HGH0030]|uniref:heptaprenylglyceryl phosphate synthase n=1 Tax=Paenisporosarcina sp. HGH0030 TaxID=1078085 RepID=UPI00034E9C1E|nr:heptaprenylglyceryl phosphate synthase [Paenisporosarcina sp. HGH0030]EPD50358.1 geranylgeranylglyceryl phosphate synthase [Paenisporosarcina sp. HGH0030]
MMYQEWRHVFKLDPAKEISEEALKQVCESGTDAILVGGTDGVTLDLVLDLLIRVRQYNVPVALEISTIDSVTPGFDFYFIPSVLNSTNTTWVKDLHIEAIKEFGDYMDWNELVPEGYCILNSDCKAARATEAHTSLSKEEVIAHARLAEHFFKFPIFYLEYSGVYGDPKMVKAAKNVLKNTRLFYGGGITSARQATEMAMIADTVVVGNHLYDNLNEALETVKAVHAVTL